VSHTPWHFPGAPYFEHGELIANHNCICLDFSTQQETILKCAYMSRVMWWDLVGYDTTPDSPNFYVMDHLMWHNVWGVKTTDSGVSSTINCKVFARFVDPITAGNVSDNGFHLTAEAQSGKETGTMGAAMGASVAATLLGAQAIFGSQGFGAHDAVMSTKTEVEEKVEESSAVVPKLWGDLTKVGASVSTLKHSASSLECRYGDDEEKHSLYALLAKPCLIRAMEYAAATATWTAVDKVHPWVSLVGAPATRLAWYAQFFRMWRGSINYLFCFTASPFYSSRWVITASYGNTAPVGQAFGDMPSYEVNVRGTTWVEVSVPFLRIVPWSLLCGDQDEDMMGMDENQIPTLYLKQLDPPKVNGDGVPVTFISVWKYAGSDFMFSSVRQCSPTDESAPIAEAQTSINAIVGKPISLGDGVSIPGFVTKCDTLYLEDMFDHFSHRNTQSGPVAGPVACGISSLLQRHHGNFDLLCQNFLFYKGSVRFKGKLATTTQTVAAVVLEPFSEGTTLTGYVPKAQQADDGMAVFALPFNPVLDFTIPFVSAFEVNTGYCFYPAQGVFMGVGGNVYNSCQAQAIIYADTLNTEFHELYVAAGKDFRLFYEYPPITRGFWPRYGSMTPSALETQSMQSALPYRGTGRGQRKFVRA